MPWTCACCTKVLPDRAIENIVMTEEGDQVSVGSDCARNIVAAGADGFFHDDPDTGPFYSIKAFEAL
jgi:hypothetical protein